MIPFVHLLFVIDPKACLFCFTSSRCAGFNTMSPWYKPGAEIRQICHYPNLFYSFYKLLSKCVLSGKHTQNPLSGEK